MLKPLSLALSSQVFLAAALLPRVDISVPDAIGWIIYSLAVALPTWCVSETIRLRSFPGIRNLILVVVGSELAFILITSILFFGNMVD